MKKAETTRLKILQKAFELIYSRGYQTTSIDDIIATTHVTKGAFFYHFKNKDEMGLAIINEILKPTLTNTFSEQLKNDQNPLDGIYNLMHKLLIKEKFLQIEYGCPVSNLIQEMAPWNIDFKNALKELNQQWTQLLTAAIEKGKRNELIRKNANAKQVTAFVLSGYWGVRNLGKLVNDKQVYQSYLKELRKYLNTLK